MGGDNRQLLISIRQNRKFKSCIEFVEKLIEHRVMVGRNSLSIHVGNECFLCKVSRA